MVLAQTRASSLTSSWDSLSKYHIASSSSRFKSPSSSISGQTPISSFAHSSKHCFAISKFSIIVIGGLRGMFTCARFPCLFKDTCLIKKKFKINFNFKINFDFKIDFRHFFLVMTWKSSVLQDTKQVRCFRTEHILTTKDMLGVDALGRFLDELSERKEQRYRDEL